THHWSIKEGIKHVCVLYLLVHDSRSHEAKSHIVQMDDKCPIKTLYAFVKISLVFLHICHDRLRMLLHGLHRLQSYVLLPPYFSYVRTALLTYALAQMYLHFRECIESEVQLFQPVLTLKLSATNNPPSFA